MGDCAFRKATLFSPRATLPGGRCYYQPALQMKKLRLSDRALQISKGKEPHGGGGWLPQGTGDGVALIFLWLQVERGWEPPQWCLIPPRP